MLKYSLYTIKNNTSYNNGIAFRDGAHTQQGSRKLILNLTGSESHPQL